MTLCAFVPPLAVKDRLVGESATAPGAGVGDAVGVDVGVGVGGLGGTTYGVVHAAKTSISAPSVKAARKDMSLYKEGQAVSTIC